MPEISAVGDVVLWQPNESKRMKSHSACEPCARRTSGFAILAAARYSSDSIARILNPNSGVPVHGEVSLFLMRTRSSSHERQ